MININFSGLPFKIKVLTVIIGIISIWIPIKLIPAINQIVSQYVSTSFFVELISMTIVYLLAIWIFPILLFKLIGKVI